MNKIFRKQQLTPYEADYAQWCAEQGALLREGRLSDLDRENVAEEIESLGRSDKREIASRLGTLVLHLLKWEFQSEQRKTGWLLTIREQRLRIEGLLDESPSLKKYPAQVLDREFKIARLKALDETGLRDRDFPVHCPYGIKEILDDDYFPGSPWSSDNLMRE
ncbi:MULTISPECIES: DUF29 domain-containing protein [unclassified Mesorhizobium]|jgi:hypothetical protein|uniref:DUF29 domain-containing protein n=1 Tax=unclassified Mesorhizobium TaxID=325217 RepID=UPI001126A54A|nr:MULTISPECIES: DUF29 domain-containing protein [unclassified Mesorhizobium]TPJ38954.1 DUF29 domain-containing protein [Mesorhizobium sp. B2-6-6]MBZ9702344.1 DUF29 domain-containing protein [Mesorhizobium sp. CO1-1-3]MBZ9856197.1 DUF29 domain-containing protein [Mesorhizobium sp. CA13]MBZ9893614.1 DUF29 domain-containing protein [Mesorhizobium sp. BR1-1-6]MBZ9920148.1 DUF29 domain-containing protein [Mesorhizobium sp. BR1-1-7]